ncbi:MAG: arginine deiminase family protein [Bacteroidales bacterium]
MKFRNAIVRRPCPEMINGITSSNLGKPDYYKAILQHDKYIEALIKCGLEVTLLESDSHFPDSCFIEDVAICTEKFAVVTNPGAISRNGEKDGMKGVLSSFFQSIYEIESPGTLDGGDVMRTGDHFYIGISDRTNHSGANQLIQILSKTGFTASKIVCGDILHLKTGLSYIENNVLLTHKRFLHLSEFVEFQKIIIPEEEEYAANSLWINGNVIVPAGFPLTKSHIENVGYKVIEVDVSEFRKLDGGLSCLSLRF